MFGKRGDGWRVPVGDDPIVSLGPYIMPTRVDGSVATRLTTDMEILTRYIRDKHQEGLSISYMELVIAAYVRTCSQVPAINRFIANKQCFQRKRISICFVAVKETDVPGELRETVIKTFFSPWDTVYTVRDKIDKAILENRKPEQKNILDKLARGFLVLPGLPTFLVGLCTLLDRYGLVPTSLLDISPFHTTMFLVNLMSLGMPAVNHHIYNFGTASQFLSIGKPERVLEPGPSGATIWKRLMPIGVVMDERVAPGYQYAKAFSVLRDMLADPKKLELPPETVAKVYENVKNT